MSKLDELLQGVDVEWKSLGEISKLKRGRVMSKNYLSENLGEYPVYSSQTANNGEIGKINSFDFSGEYITWTTDGANAGTVFHRKGKFSITNVCGLIEINNHIKLIYKYLYFYLSIEAKNHVYAGMGNPKLMSHQMEKIKIPIPCPDNPEKSLEIQQEIVRVLDELTSLTNQLTTELETERQNRKKQFEFFREQLFSFEEGNVEYKTLRDVAIDFGRGKSKHRPRNDQKLYGGNIPFIQTGDVRNASRIIENYTQTYTEFGLKQSKLWPKGTLCITIAANIAETSILGFEACFPDSIIGFVANQEITSSKYVEYLISNFKSKLENMGQGCAQININLSTFENLRLPFPPLEEQERIVKLLDQFDATHAAIEEEITKEIKLRTQQYEYYREKLLTFPEN